MLDGDEKARSQIYITVALPTNKIFLPPVSTCCIFTEKRGILHELGAHNFPDR